MPKSNNRTHPVRPMPQMMGPYKGSSNSNPNSSEEGDNLLREGNYYNQSELREKDSLWQEEMEDQDYSDGKQEGSGIEDEGLLPEHNNATDSSSSPLVSQSEADEKGSGDGDLEFLDTRGLPYSTEV